MQNGDHLAPQSEQKAQDHDGELMDGAGNNAQSRQDLDAIPNGLKGVLNGISRGRKRKHNELSNLTKSRALSPPWKKIEAEGPTSFVEDGRRKSCRTNALPSPAPPLSKKRHIRVKTGENDEKIPTPTPVEAEVKPRPRRGRPPARAKVVEPEPVLPIPQRPKGKVGRPRKDRSLQVSQFKEHSPPESQQRRLITPNLSTTSPTETVRTLGRRRSSRRPIEPVQDPTRDVNPKVRKLRLNFRRPSPPVLHPGNLAPRKRFESLADWLYHDNALEGEDERKLTNEEILNEAKIRERLRNATNLFDGNDMMVKDVATLYEPSTQYTHPDYLLKHLEDFQPRLERERKEHMAVARRTAHMALAEWKRRQPQTEEEVTAKERRQVEINFKKWMKELEHRWLEVMNMVKKQKLNKWEQEQQALRKKALNDMLQHSTDLLVTRRRRRSGSHEDGIVSHASGSNESDGTNSEEGSTADSEDIDEVRANDDNSEDDNDDDDNNHGSSHRSPSEQTDNSDAFSDDNLSPEELRRKYANISSNPLRAEADETTKEGRAANGLFESLVDLQARPVSVELDNNNSEPEEGDPTRYRLDDVDEILLDGSEGQSDSDVDTSETSESEDTQDSDEEESDQSKEDAEDNHNHSLLGFFSVGRRKELGVVTDVQESVKDDTQADAKHLEHSTAKKLLTQANSVRSTENFRAEDSHSPSEVLTDQRTPNTTTETKPSNSSATSIEPEEQRRAANLHAGSLVSAVKTEIPPLLRGQLREYQHYGLDWLAGMYSNNTNGILADEMGLGKTIQTIALLAHLATLEKDPVWGPHLVVVPTSVMLNWEMEFKKWCPGFKVLAYYGTQEERKEKRKGWASDDRWNVVITSYQLALQDVVPLKRKHWHYMILDEAHNIKNFRSKRWETLLTFNTRNRLLLTGTPLQNNLSELWSLLFFLDPGKQSQDGFQFADLTTFSKMFHRPVEQILEHGREAMDDDAKEVVAKLHKVLRPHLLRRLKADVEKQMPKKYEHITKCRLSKRQRQLYDGYMGLARTRESFTSGNYLSIINCLMQLRKVCNHPDLFETRQIVTSFVMPKSAVADYEIKELLIRRTLFNDGDKRVNMRFVNLRPAKGSTMDAYRGVSLSALKILQTIAQRQVRGMPDRPRFDGRSMVSALTALDMSLRSTRLSEISDQYKYTYSRIYNRSLYSENFLRLLGIVQPIHPLTLPPPHISRLTNHYLSNSSYLRDMITSLPQRSESLNSAIQMFGCVTPVVVAPNMARYSLTDAGMKSIQRVCQDYPDDYFHEPRIRLSIAFPDKRLIQYDCGKLQQLARLLRQLQDGGHRALIFTQMTKVLDILEQFLNLHGHRYLRLDGATRVEQRQILTDRFNNDPRILAFILSSRSGGIGINLTGADTVIFYDLDWNPAMDKQCQDRCHRIGQTRDVHIYRFVCEGTIEANILRKSNQKRMLDDVVIQEGEFTTDYFNQMELDDKRQDEVDAEADAALDKVLGGGRRPMDRVLQQAEDQEDRDAAIVAQKEYVADDADFEEKAAAEAAIAEESAVAPSTLEPKALVTPLDQALPFPSAGVVDSTAPKQEDMNEYITPEQEHAMDSMLVDDVTPSANHQAEVEEADEPGSFEEYMLRFMEWDLRDVMVLPPSERSRKRAKKGKDHGMAIRRPR